MKPYLSTLVSRKEGEIRSLMVNDRPKGLPFSALTSSGYREAYKAYQLEEQGFFIQEVPLCTISASKGKDYWLRQSRLKPHSWSLDEREECLVYHDHCYW